MEGRLGCVTLTPAPTPRPNIADIMERTVIPDLEDSAKWNRGSRGAKSKESRKSRRESPRNWPQQQQS